MCAKIETSALEINMFVILVILSLICVFVVGDSDDQQIIIAFNEPEKVTCSRIGITGYPDHYGELVGTQWRLFKCAKFFVFDEQACGCIFKFPVIQAIQILQNIVPPETPPQTPPTISLPTTEPTTIKTTKLSSLALPPIIKAIPKRRRRPPPPPPPSTQPTTTKITTVSLPRTTVQLPTTKATRKTVLTTTSTATPSLASLLPSTTIKTVKSTTPKITTTTTTKRPTTTKIPATTTERTTTTERKTTTKTSSLPTTTSKRTTKTTTTTPTTTEPTTSITSTTTTRKATTSRSNGCKKIPNPENPVKYKEEVTGHGFVDRRCPAGTIFSGESCECEADTRPKKKKKGLCDGCKFDRGVGYNEHFNRCDKYIICYPDARNQSKLIGVMRQCDVGEYWDQELMTCIRSVDAYCENDPCALNRTLTMYSYEGHCRGYWVCRYGVSIGQCCPQGQAFKEGIGCVPDYSCKSSCKHTTAKVETCDKRYVPYKPSLFQQMIKGHGYVTMRCAAGTIFNQTLCECDTDNRPKSELACNKEVEMNFTQSVTTTIENRVHVAAVNVHHENGSACFYGDSALVIPRFSNAIIGKRLEIRIKYKMRKLSNSNKGDKLQALVYNGDCGPDASISVTVTPRRTVFGLRNDFNESRALEIKSWRENYGWKYTKFSLRNEVMTLEENGLRKQRRFYGSVSKSICGLKIGWGKGFESFKGCINQLSISICPS